MEKSEEKKEQTNKSTLYTRKMRHFCGLTILWPQFIQSFCVPYNDTMYKGTEHLNGNHIKYYTQIIMCIQTHQY